MYAYTKKPGRTPHIQRFVFPIARGDGFELPDDQYENLVKECPIPIEIIPNYMGINLCAVESIEWSKTPDGSLVDLKINFNCHCEDMIEEESLVKAKRDYWKACCAKNVDMTPEQINSYMKMVREVEGPIDDDDDGGKDCGLREGCRPLCIVRGVAGVCVDDGDNEEE